MYKFVFVASRAEGGAGGWIASCVIDSPCLFLGLIVTETATREGLAESARRAVGTFLRTIAATTTIDIVEG